GAVLERECVHGAGDVRIAAVWREQRPADDDPVDGTRERGQPTHRAFPRQAFGAELAARAVDVQRGLEQRRPTADEEISATGKLDCCARSPVQHAERVQGAVGWMDARQREPVIAGQLPRDGGFGSRVHEQRIARGSAPARRARASQWVQYTSRQDEGTVAQRLHSTGSRVGGYYDKSFEGADNNKKPRITTDIAL